MANRQKHNARSKRSYRVHDALLTWWAYNSGRFAGIASRRKSAVKSMYDGVSAQ